MQVGDSQGLHILNPGSTVLSTSSHSFFLSNVLYVPHISKSLLFIYQFSKNNNIHFEFLPPFFMSSIEPQVLHSLHARVIMTFIRYHILFQLSSLLQSLLVNVFQSIKGILALDILYYA